MPTSDEVLAQLFDRGEIDIWRALYRIAANEPELRQRILRIVTTVPAALPRFWLAAMANLGEPVDLTVPVPDYLPDGI